MTAHPSFQSVSPPLQTSDDPQKYGEKVGFAWVGGDKKWDSESAYTANWERHQIILALRGFHRV